MKHARLLGLILTPLLLQTSSGAASASENNVAAQATAAKPSATEELKVDNLDPALAAIVPQGAKLETLATGYTWVEGPLWTRSGDLLFAEITSNSIRKLSPDGTVSVLRQPSGFQGKEAYGGKEPGSNGMTMDQKGRVTVAGHAQRDIYRLETADATSTPTVLADSYQGKKLNSPNDLVYRSDGSIYFTDPPYGLRTQRNSDPEKELPFNGVYRIPHAATQAAGAAPDRASLQLLIRDLSRPNGIAFSPDEKFLYVNNTEPKKYWMKYPVQPDGTLGPGTVFFDASSDGRPGSPDGMKVDTNGNLYSTGPGGIWIFSPAGKHLGTLLMPEPASNVAWGGADGKTLYITMTSSVRRVRLLATGIRPAK